MTLFEISLKKLFPSNIDQLSDAFRNKLELDITNGTQLDFDITDRAVIKRKIKSYHSQGKSQRRRSYRRYISNIYNGSYPYKEMEDPSYIRKLILDPNYEIFVYADIDGKVARMHYFRSRFCSKARVHTRFHARKEISREDRRD